MKIIFPLLALFAIGCVLYGISAGVQAIVRGLSRLADAASNGEESAPPPPTKRPLRMATTASAPAPAPPNQPAEASATGASSMQRSIAELREIFALYQQGALTQEEFERMKQCLLSAIDAETRQQPIQKS